MLHVLLHSILGAVVQHELIIIADKCFLLAYTSAHSQIYKEISGGCNNLLMIPAGRWRIETPSKALPWTHHHQYAVLHSKANSQIWVERYHCLSPALIFLSFILCARLSK